MTLADRRRPIMQLLVDSLRQKCLQEKHTAHTPDTRASYSALTQSSREWELVPGQVRSIALTRLSSRD